MLGKWNFGLLVTVDELSHDHQRHFDSPNKNHERLCQISWESIAGPTGQSEQSRQTLLVWL